MHVGVLTILQCVTESRHLKHAGEVDPYGQCDRTEGSRSAWGRIPFTRFHRRLQQPPVVSVERVLDVDVFGSTIPRRDSRFVVGWAMSAVNDRHLRLRALEMALKRRCPEAGSVHHSDQGCSYASEDYRERLKQHGITCSMSRRGNCYDNAVMDSWFSTVKSEEGERLESYAHAKEPLFDYSEVFYNQRRRLRLIRRAVEASRSVSETAFVQASQDEGIQVLTTGRLLAGVVIIGAGIIAAVLTVGPVRARLPENEASALRKDNDASAIGALRAIGAAQARYRQRCTGYANLSELIRAGELAPPGKLTGESTVMTNGYKISVETAGVAIPIANLAPRCVGSHTDFFSHADPIALGRTGSHYFASDSRQTIFLDSAPMTYPPKPRAPQ